MTLLGVFGGGLFLIPLILIGASAFSFYKAYKQRESGMAGTIIDPRTGEKKYVESDKKLSYTEIGAFWFGVMFLCGFIVSVVLMISDK